MQLAEDINFTTEKKELLSEKIHDEILELIIKNASEEEQVLNEKRLVELFLSLIHIYAELIYSCVHAYVLGKSGKSEIKSEGGLRGNIMGKG